MVPKGVPRMVWGLGSTQRVLSIDFAEKWFSIAGITIKISPYFHKRS